MQDNGRAAENGALANTGEGKTFGYYLSRVISYVFHPFLMPFYMVLFLFVTNLVPLYLTLSVKRYLVSVIIINTICVPAIAVILMRLMGLIKDYSLSTRHDRTLPLIIVALCYGLCGWMLADIPALFLVRRCMYAAMGATIFAMVVNFWWQISLHMTAIGGAVGIVFILFYGGYYNLIWLLCAAILSAGALGTARLYLRKHDLAQVGYGFLGGFCICVLIILLST